MEENITFTTNGTQSKHTKKTENAFDKHRSLIEKGKKKSHIEYHTETKRKRKRIIPREAIRRENACTEH